MDHHRVLAALNQPHLYPIATELCHTAGKYWVRVYSTIANPALTLRPLLEYLRVQRENVRFELPSGQTNPQTGFILSGEEVLLETIVFEEGRRIQVHAHEQGMEAQLLAYASGHDIVTTLAQAFAGGMK